MRFNSLFYLIVSVIFLLGKCDDHFKTTKSGLKYVIHKDIVGESAKDGERIQLHLVFRTLDSTYFNTFKTGNPAAFIIKKEEQLSPLMEGLAMLSEGDSATFMINADSIFKNNRPDFLKAGEIVFYDVKLLNILTEEAYQQERYKRVENRLKNIQPELERDIEPIERWLEDENLIAQKTPYGLYYIIEQEGNGAYIKNGDLVKVHYKGSLLNSKQFDSSRDRQQAFEFEVGVGQVILAWDHGLKLFKKGGKGKLIIPSAMAYGTRGSGKLIPPNSVLIFDIDVLDVVTK